MTYSYSAARERTCARNLKNVAFDY